MNHVCMCIFYKVHRMNTPMSSQQSPDTTDLKRWNCNLQHRHLIFAFLLVFQSFQICSHFPLELVPIIATLACPLHPNPFRYIQYKFYYSKGGPGRGLPPSSSSFIQAMNDVITFISKRASISKIIISSRTKQRFCWRSRNKKASQ